MKHHELRHAIRNWTDGIKFTTEMLPKIADPEQQQQMFESILTAAEQCMRHIEDFLDKQQEDEASQRTSLDLLMEGMSRWCQISVANVDWDA